MVNKISNTIIRLAKETDRSNWDSYVYSHVNGTPYHFYCWKDALVKSYGHKPIYLMSECKGRISGIFPIFQFNIPFMSKKFISLPFCDIGDVLADNSETEAMLLRYSLSKLKRNRAKSLEIRCHSKNSLCEEFPDIKVFQQSDKVRMLLALPKSSDLLWNGFKSKLRSQIKKAEKNNLLFKWGTHKDIDAFYNVFSNNMHSLGSPVHSKGWIEEILIGYGNRARMGLVYHKNKPIGGGIILCTNDSACIPWASTLREYNRLNPNMIMYWEFLKYVTDSGRNRFDFGRSTPNEGTYRFKKQWGAIPEVLVWYRFGGNEPNNRQVTSKINKEHAVRAWQGLPLSVANCFGPKIRKFISL